MENFLNWQIDYLLMLQNFREATNGILNPFFMFITTLGEFIFPTMLAAIIYWCINNRWGMYIFWNWSIGQFVCQFLKSLACIYRPWVLDSRIIPIDGAIKMAGGYSFPSGHTQAAVGIWGAMAVCFKNKFITAFLIILILLIGFSRNYIGVHTPQDVIVSLFVGIVVLIFSAKLMDWVDKGKNRDIITFIGVILSSIALVVYEFTKTYPLDYVNGELLVDPMKMQMYTFPKIGLLIGFFTGWILNRRFIGFDAIVGSSGQKVLRGVIGLALLSLVFEKSRILFEFYDEPRLTMFMSAFLSSLFITGIYPAIIVYIRKKFKKL